jgi:hypothetical protein
MTNDELTAEVKALEHRLTELWGWDELGRIGWNLNLARMDMEPGNDEIAEAIKGLELECETHLANCYSRALHELELTLKALPSGPVLNALLERLQGSLRLMAEHSFRNYLEHVPQPEEHHFNNAIGTRPQAQIEQAYEQHRLFTRDAWACIEKDLGDYLGRVTAYIATATGNEQTPSPTVPNRIPWTCSTAVYVHIVKELFHKGYIATPDMNGKEGEANITELFRRLSQAFIVTGKNGNELAPDELQRRFDGRQLAQAKAARLTFPEAKEVK